METDDLLCSRNARPQKALVGRAQERAASATPFKRGIRSWKGLARRSQLDRQLTPVGLTFHDPLAIFTIKLLPQSRLVLSRTSSLFP
jgi:hypothetical protein